MSIKAALFACVIAAGVGCRSDHSSEETGYGRTVESTEPAVSTTHSDEAGHTVHETGAGMGAGVESGPSHATDYPVDESGTANENTGAEVTTGRAVQGEAQGRRTIRATRGSTMGFGGRYVAPNEGAAQAPDTQEPSTTPAEPAPASQGTGDAPPPAPTVTAPAAQDQPSSGLNETASGNGTTTNTGTNTENAGNGNTDNPNQ